MDFMHPVEVLIPGARGRLLGALARVDAELAVSRLAEVAGVGRTRASTVLEELAHLGLVERRRVGQTILVSLARDNAAGQLVACLSGLRRYVISELQQAAGALDPRPESLILFGSLARGSATAVSDIDILAVRPREGSSERWQASLSELESLARRLTGNSVQVLDYDLDDLKTRYSVSEGAAGASFWRSVTQDAVVLAGSSIADLMAASDAAR
jgi:predicted nucleotidyltransferase